MYWLLLPFIEGRGEDVLAVAPFGAGCYPPKSSLKGGLKYKPCIGCCALSFGEGRGEDALAVAPFPQRQLDLYFILKLPNY